MKNLGFRRKAKTGQKRVVRGVVSRSLERRKSALRHIYPMDGKQPFSVFVGTARGSAKIKAWRMSVGLSADQLAKRLGHHRTYVKHLESKKNPWVLLGHDAEKLNRLSQELKSQVRFSGPVSLKIFSRFVLQDDTVNLVRPRRCRGHGKLMLFPCQTQVYCDQKRECRRLWRRKQKED